MLNCINWQSLDVLPPEATEYTYFVLEISSAGAILVTNTAQEAAFVSKVHGMGKRATFSIAGGSQNVQDITNAIYNHRAALLNNIAAHITRHGYDGVVVDIENTSIRAAAMTNFIGALRQKLNSIRPGLILGIYTQPYQINTVWATIGTVAPAITWLSAMIYDYPNTVAVLESDTLKWAAKLPKSKLLVGVAVNYDATGLDLTEFPAVLKWLNSQGFKGLGIWQNQLYTSDYRNLVKQYLNP